MNTQTVLRQLKKLPPQRQQEVADFVAFLSERAPKPAKSPPRSQRKFSEEPFFGMWKNREDMADSTEWVRRLRRKEWGE